jgi:hypothetical protein
MSESKEYMSQSSKTVLTIDIEGYISNKGKKSLGKGGQGATIGQERRFRPSSANNSTPGPGY